ncbi:NitT/TauT family transport system ATP-binding protein [Dethiosulfatibacter aminovorans DSM 17477]|uniref:NitT/TauT family transport system ATP-binding protein n=1 Tax=Dethiosulfatibacter aminovorans DSM 17477 TaxID=1121476 RepID=A0A1M6FXP8_9FIRM|nr:ABC transporter ATP-binding protein [Dethiosulfatibacter aminovorans]SHJ02508.1 NitT/TauT family transport system ATP-binding protein [Dethiosulfatibacter aminovorans DSM 17477]
MISISNLTKKFHNKTVFDNFSIDIEENKISCILGASGIGKSTLIKLLSGLDRHDSGEIEGMGNKEFSYIFQEPRLLPWLNVYDNVDFILKAVYSDKDERKRIILENLKLVDLESSANLFPDELSGGMMQRLSIARAFSYPAKILFMDEPFSGLDIKLKMSVMDSFRKIWAQSSKTVVFITHDIDEAVFLADKIYVLADSPARIVYEKDIKINIMKRSFNDDTTAPLKKELLKVISDN